jgi:hypothetical protein
MENSERKSVIVQFRVPPDESKKLQVTTKSVGKKLSNWLRETSLRAT